MSYLFLSTLLLALSGIAQAEDAEIAHLFGKAGVEGTLVIESAATGQRYVHNETRAKQPFTAASTFKVLNTLIALEEGAIAGADEVIAWDGTHYEIEDWNRDQTLKSAFKVSCVWCYQWLARRVGAQAYPSHVRQADYGELREPFNDTEFWLDGSLIVSAEQQVAFLRRVVERSLPYRAGSYDTLRAIMQVDSTPAYRLYAKTAGLPAARRVSAGMSATSSSTNIWLFALNIDTRGATDQPLRQQIVLEALRAKALLPPL